MARPTLPCPALEAQVRASRVPGLQYLVVDRAQTVFELALGWADLAGRRPMTLATTMMAYSMSKTITAAAVLQLVEAGKVGLDDPIDRYLEPPAERRPAPHPSYLGRGITVRELLCHTSGLPNPLPLRWVHPVARHDGFDEGAALAAVLAARRRPASEPGTRYAYSNLGYWLLGGIVERASGEPFTAYVAEQVLRPLAIPPGELGYAIAQPRDHAAGYLERFSSLNLLKRLVIDRELVGGSEGRWVRIRDHYLNGPAFGGLVGSARGFGRFLQDQLASRSLLFGEATRALFYSAQSTRRGRPIAMTLGWHVGARRGTRFFYKEGGGGGFHCMMRLYPEPGIGTVLMTNATGFDVRRQLDLLDPQFLARPA